MKENNIDTYKICAILLIKSILVPLVRRVTEKMGKKKKYIPGKDYSRREIIEFILQEGWTIESKGATGHVICRKAGELPFDLPTDPKKGTKQMIFKRLGFK